MFETIASSEAPTVASMTSCFFDAGFMGGVRLEDGLVFAVTEKRTKEEIDKLVKIAAL